MTRKMRERPVALSASAVPVIYFGSNRRSQVRTVQVQSSLHHRPVPVRRLGSWLSAEPSWSSNRTAEP
jgi:hypothetical protein